MSSNNTTPPTSATSNNSGLSDDQATLFCTVFTILLSCSLVGNITLITVILANKTLKTSFNFLVVNMAISDLFLPLLIIPYEVSNKIRLTEDWPVGGLFGHITCKLYWFMVDFSLGVSIFSLVVIATNRFVAIVFPVHVGLANTMQKRSKLFMALTWILAAILFSPHFSLFKLKEKKCGLDGDTSFLTIYYGVISFATFFIPFSIITVLYAMIVLKLYRQSESLDRFLNDTQYRARQKRNKHIFFLSIAIILSCAVLVGPLFSFIFTINFILKWKLPKKSDLIFFILNCLYYLYTSSNPVIYFVFVKSFRRGLKRLLCGKLLKREQTYLRSSNHRGGLSSRYSIVTANNPIEQNVRVQMQLLNYTDENRDLLVENRSNPTPSKITGVTKSLQNQKV